MSNLDALLDQNLDDIADLPAFAPFPAGAHRCTVEFVAKEIGVHPAVECNLIVIETLELSSPVDAVPLKAGDATGVAYMLDNEFGAGKLKALLAPFAEFAGTVNLRGIMEALKGAEVIVVTKQSTNKAKTAVYTEIVKMELV